MFCKVLVANRGEIAVRIIRALRELDIPSVATFSEVDRVALHVQMADEALCIGPAPSSESYLCGDRILEAAQKTGATAIHPGYGFLSENAAFARNCERAGIKFIGPSWLAIEQMGSKTAARRIAAEAGAPIVPGTEKGLDSVEERRAAAEKIGYPVLLKAAAGGGGKGMRRVDAEADLESAFQAASSEAERAFGSGEVYIEKLIERPRHIEIQVLGDEHGHVIHLGERECSIQRRHQKVVEECPSPLMALHPQLRHRMGQAALKIARAVRYSNAGTLEFLADQRGRFYFLEMNTRLQVEHPVTELVTGLDLVHWQIRIAAGERLTVMQEDIHWHGSALECRIYAEDPANNYMPSPGGIAEYVEPSGPGVRVDAGVFPGWTVPMEYDPLLAKLSVWASDRPMAIERMRRAIEEYRVLGISTNLQLFGQILRDSRFRSGNLDTGFLESLESATRAPDGDAHAAAVLAAARHTAQLKPPASAAAPESAWRTQGRKDLLR
jgi:acetyl-CoA carboxylase, biotin carboxylase subunit